jgi:hypothetical protein
MPPPHEEMKSLRNELQSNERTKLYTTEAREHWMERERNRGTTDPEAAYKKFAATKELFTSWRDEMISSFETSRVRLGPEERFSNELTSVDRRKLNLKDSRDLFADRAAKTAYDNLTDCFSDNVLSGNAIEGFYNFDVTDVVEFGNLLGEARAGADRNATQLSVDLATAMALAGQEVFTATGKRTAWEGHELYEPLQELKQALTDWNEVLAEGAVPDKTKLKNRAKECADCLEACYKVHGSLVTGKAATPIVKYQLLATMKAIGEKVASQYAARAGKASLTAMYELIRDVPNRGPADQATQKAQELAGKYNGDLGKSWTGELTKLGKELRRADKTVEAKLQAEIGNNAGELTDALTNWQSSFGKLDALKNNREGLRDTVAQIAFGLQQRKAIVDRVLATPASPEVKAMRDRYHQTFDGFAQQLHQDIQQCRDTLQ